MKILIISSSKNNSLSLLFPFLKKLEEKFNHELKFFANNKPLAKKCQENNWKNKRIRILSFNSKSTFFSFFSLLFFPITCFFYLNMFLVCKSYKESNALILVSTAEKILFTIPAKIFKKKIIWLNLPGKNQKLNLIQNKLILILSKYTKTIVFTDSEKIDLEKKKIKSENIEVLYFGISTKNHTHQENIFSEIAETQKINNLKSKFFTIGTIAELNDTKNIEILFSAIKKCVTIIPNIQFIIVGEGKARKNLTWIAKKMEIDNLVWFVGNNKNQRKWLESFNIMLANCERLNLLEMKNIMEGMACNTSLITAHKIGIEYLVEDGENGIVIDMNSSDDISTQIIRIQQNTQLQVKLQTNAKHTIDNFFKLGTMVGNFEKILKR